jgi:hypothetical protein
VDILSWRLKTLRCWWYHFRVWFWKFQNLVSLFSTELCMGRPWVTHLKMGNPWVPMGTHWGNCKYLFSNQMLCDKMHIGWKLVYFCIDSNKQLFNIEKGSGNFRSFLINPQLKCFEIFLIFHELLLRLQNKIEIKIFLNWSQESLEKNSWIPIAMLWCSIKTLVTLPSNFNFR